MASVALLVGTVLPVNAFEFKHQPVGYDADHTKIYYMPYDPETGPTIAFDYTNYSKSSSVIDLNGWALMSLGDRTTAVKITTNQRKLDIKTGYIEAYGFSANGVVLEVSNSANHDVSVSQYDRIYLSTQYLEHENGIDPIGAGIAVTSVGGDLISGVLSADTTQIGAPLKSGVGGDAGNIVVLAGGIDVEGAGGAGVLAQSIGGSGGNGTSNGQSVGLIGGADVGNKADAGGNGGRVEVILLNDLTTNGSASDGILAHSIGGGGGVGHGTTSGAGVAAVAIGGAGGGGGHGGEVIITTSKIGHIQTFGALSAGILAQSVGGGGGRGGNARAFGVFYSHAVGGSGGAGGDGGKVNVTSKGNITTHKGHATGIHAQSIGGGGGTGGAATAHSIGPFFTASVAIGGKGGKGGTSATTTVRNEGIISTHGDFSTGVKSQSIAGGGGHGGHAHAYAASVSYSGDMPSVSLSFSMGGAGGKGGNAGKAVASSINTINTKGAHAIGLSAESVGGGGGSGGNALAVAVSAATTVAISASVTLGGDGGSASDGGNATVANSGTISTEGDFSTGLYAQSVGGGGGNGGSATSVSVAIAAGTEGESGAVAVSVALAGNGGKGGKGKNAVAFHKSGNISTRGMRAYGVHSMSVGGGGGAGGHATSVDVALNLNLSPDQTKQGAADIAVTLGGGGGEGGTSGHSYAIIAGDVSTLDHQSHGVFAQSIAGGGGAGGSVTSITVTATGKLDPTESGTKGQSTLLAGAFSVAIGGDAGYGNYAAPAKIWLKDGATVTTRGDGAHAIFAQSVGGSGGDGGNATDYSASLRFSGKFEMKPAKIHDVPTGKSFPQNNLGKGKSVNLQLSIGGSGGYAGDGAEATIQLAQNTKVSTEGINSSAIFAQSTGGGGGNGGSAYNVVYSANDSKSFGLSVGGNGKMGGTGGTVGIYEDLNDTPVTKLVKYADGKAAQIVDAGIITTGQQSHGIHAQSVGGGGGNGGAAHLSNKSVNAYTPIDGGTSVAINVGSSGGVAGNGGKVYVKRDNRILTTGHQSHAIFAQSVGGGGGNAGAVSVRLKGLSLGGHGGGAGFGQEVDIFGNNQIQTVGNQSHGILAQSIGGGGGQASSLYGDSYVVDRSKFILGGSGGNGNHGGVISVTEQGDILTHGEGSHGIMMQSIGGGGGNILLHDFGSGAVGNSPDWYLRGGNGGGEAINLLLNAGASITTKGRNSNAVFAQSIGGGGGFISETGNQSLTQNGVLNNTESAAKAESGVGDGGAINLDNNGQIATFGENSYGIFAQSVGGGGVQVVNHRFKAAQSAHSYGNSSLVTIANGGGITINAKGGAAIRAESSGYASGKNFISGGILINNKGTIIANHDSIGIMARIDANCPISVQNCWAGHFELINEGSIKSSHAITLELNQYSPTDSIINNKGVINGDIHYFSQYEKTATADDRNHMPHIGFFNFGTFSGGIYASEDGEPKFTAANLKKSDKFKIYNYSDATFNSGAYIHAKMINNGLINPGGIGGVRVSRFKDIENVSIWKKAPILQFDVNFKNGTSDEITAEFSKDFGDAEIQVKTVGYIKTNDQVHALVDMGTKNSIDPHKIKQKTLDTPVVDYHLKVDKNTIKLVGATVDYVKAAKSKNSQNLAKMLVNSAVANAAAKTTGPQAALVVLPAGMHPDVEMALANLANAPDEEAVKKLFENLTVEGVTTAQAIMTVENLNFISDGAACSINGMSELGAAQIHCGAAIANAKLGFHDGMGIGADYTDRLFEVGARVGGKLGNGLIYSAAVSSGFMGATVGGAELGGKFIRVGGEVAQDFGEFRLKAMGMLGYAWYDQTRNMGVNGLIANSKFGILSGAAGLGIDTQFMHDGIKINPGIDFLAAFTRTTEVIETGGGALGASIGADTDITLAIKPYVSFSSVKKLDNGWTMMPKLKLGATWLVDNQFEHDVAFNNAAALGNITQQRNHDRLTFDVSLAVEFKRDDNLAINLGYSGKIGQSSSNHSLSAGFKYRF